MTTSAGDLDPVRRGFDRMRIQSNAALVESGFFAGCKSRFSPPGSDPIFKNNI
jgi:hypothetical protein